LQRKERVVAMFRTVWVSLAQVIAADVILYGCRAAASAAPRSSEPGIADGVPFGIAVTLLVPLGAMFIGPLVATRLRLAAGAAYCLSVVIVVVLVVGLGLSHSSLGNVPVILLILLILTTANLLIGYSTGMDRNWSPPPSTPSSVS
jgi:hypothetical protein